MIENFQVVLDVWEGQLEVNEAALQQGGVAGLVIRLNDMNGGHHQDTGFNKQWSETPAAMLKAPYFVYNPWVKANANYLWLANNCPETSIVFVDVEVRYSAITPTNYGLDVSSFCWMASQRWKRVVIYTGGAFVNLLAAWPQNYDYWWARYPLSLYPDKRETWNWEMLRKAIGEQTWPKISGFPEPKLWQCSGDRLILPGTSRPVDINVFRGTMEELRIWWGEEPTPGSSLPAPDPSLKGGEKEWEEAIDAWARGMGYQGPKPK